MKKILISIFSALLLGGISLPASAQAQTGPASKEIWYTATSAVTPTNILGTNGAVLTVTGNDYDESTGIGKITFSGDVITIGMDAFKSCKVLSSITIPASVTSIGNSAFSGCYDFSTKTGLTTVIFAEGSKLETIGKQAFYNCQALSSITIPASVTSIGNGAFTQCYALESISVDANNTVYSSPNNCNAIIETATHKLIQGCKSTVIPESVEIIGENAFWMISTLESITIPANVKSIGNSAFYMCYDIMTRTGLTTVTFAEGSQLETIGEKAFSCCLALSSPITIPAYVTSIGKSAFDQCSKLTEVTFAEDSKLVTIGECAFGTCSALSSPITIPASVTSIEKSAFSGCSKLTEVTFAEGSQLVTIGEYAFYNCKALSSITIPASVTSIGKSAFQNCTGIKSVIVNWAEAGKIVPITNAKLQLQEGSTLLVPAGTEDLYENATGWSSFKNYMKPYITANQDPNNKKDYYATFYSSSKAYKLSTEDVTAYTGAVDGSVLKLKPIADGIIPAGEGVVLKLTSTDDTEAKVNILVEKSTEAGTKDTENVLTGTDTAIDSAPAGTKAFSLGESGVGFYLWTGNPIGAHKAYIPAVTQE